MLVIGVAVVFLIALGWRRMLAETGDEAAAIVDLSARRLAATRPEWGRAMAAELSSIEGRPTRLRFALGCARAAVLPPLVDASPEPGGRVAIAAITMTLIGLGILVQRRAESAISVGERGAVYEGAVAVLVLALVGSHAWMVDRRMRERSGRAAAARRAGVAAGVLLGALALVSSLPMPGSLSSSPVGSVAPFIAFPLMIVGCLLTGVVAARMSGDGPSGHEAGVWAGRVAGSIVGIGLLAVTLWASGWLVHDPGTIRAYGDTLATAHFASYATHFRTIGAYVSSENVDTALISSLVLFPLIGFVFGGMGGVLGSTRHVQADGSSTSLRPA